jgi:hypothetical protein
MHVLSLRAYVLGITLAALALGGCGSSAAPGTTDVGHSLDSSAPAIDPTTLPGFSFTAHPLPGFSGASAISFQTPPYPFGAANDGNGNLAVIDRVKAGVGSINLAPRVPYDVRFADFNGDGIPDVISSVYTPTNVESTSYLFLGNADGTFTQDTTFGMQYQGPGGPGYRGRTETIVVADFNNDGTVDVFIPVYTYLDAAHDISGVPYYVGPGAPPNVYNALQNFLLLNDGTGKFVERAVAAGVSMHSTLSGITPASTDPEGNQPEGAQAVDFNMDGLIDLYVGGHLFINQGVDADGVPHFKDMAAAMGLTQEILRSPPTWANNAQNALPAHDLVTDEGAKFLDWNNDGRLDLLLYRWDWGTAHGERLFEFDGQKFIERKQALTAPTPTCPHPVSGNIPFFQTSRPIFNGGAGNNVYDLDNDGLEDVLVSGDSTGSAVFRNYGCGFAEVQASGLPSQPGGSGGMALADFDRNGSIDVIYTSSSGGTAYYENTSPQGKSFVVEVLGPKGEHNQFGRVIQVFPPGTSQIFTRVVDGGSGYLTQNQYPLLVGTPFEGAHRVKVYFAPLTKCMFGGPPCQPAVLTFSISPGQHALAFAPDAGNPNGHFVLATN